MFGLRESFGPFGLELHWVVACSEPGQDRAGREVCDGRVDDGVVVLSALCKALALAGIVHGSETRVRRMEPDAVIVLVACVLMLVAVAVRA